MYFANPTSSGIAGTLRGVAASRRNGKLSVPLPFEDAVKAALEAEPPKGVGKAKKARVASRSKRKKS
jgi:hypothetical protein